MPNDLYAVVDIETTGGMARRDRITEIAIVLYDGQKIIDRFESLVNPERSIPWEITRITGITDDMVQEAPKFYEIAKKVVEFTQDAIFVAHNVRFDYSFIREEFASLGFTFQRPQLCTVVLSRKSFPGLRSYSLGNLISHFGIEVENRHRAMDDVLATVNILDRALRQEAGVIRARRLVAAGIRQTKMPERITPERIQALPDEPGVYYFYNVHGQVIYVGKSIHIRKRVLQHFGGKDGKTDKLLARVADITCTLTGSELIAMLLESSEIKHLQPEINKAQRAREFPYFIHTYTNAQGYLCLQWDKTSQKGIRGKTILNYYASKSGVRATLHQVCEHLQLCAGLTGIYEPGAGCFYYQTGSCTGACQGMEDPDSYNERALQASNWLNRSFHSDFCLITEGRQPGEKGLVLIRDGQYRGYTYASESLVIHNVHQCVASVEEAPPNPECNQIILSWLESYPDTYTIPI